MPGVPSNCRTKGRGTSEAVSGTVERIPAMKIPDHDKPLTDSELEDLFRQMDKQLKRRGGVILPSSLLACEVENVYRMKATIIAQQRCIESYEKEQRSPAMTEPRKRVEDDNDRTA